MSRITEPTTMITDFILAIEAIIFSIIIFNNYSTTAQLLWAFAFVITSFGAVLGGITHGFKEYTSDETERIIWRLTLLSVGLGGVLMFLGILYAVINASLTIITAILIVSYIIYAVWILRNDKFIFVIIYYLPMLIGILIIELFNLSSPSAIWFISGILSTFIGFGIQIKGYKLHEHFNHNDIFHVIQMFAVYLLFIGVINI